MINFNKKLKIIFFGSNLFSLSILKEIYRFNELKILCTITKKNIFNPIKLFSIENNLIFLESNNLLDYEIINKINNLNPDIIIIVSYGNIIPDDIIKIPKFGCINIHCSLLPKWRGPFPIYWSIISGDNESGITIIKINSKIDSGNIIFQKKCKISQRETYISLQNKLLKISCESIIDILFKFIKNFNFNEKKQESYINYKYAKKINKKLESKINWNLSSLYIDRKIRAINIYGAYFNYKNKYIKVWDSEILTIKKNKYPPGKIIYINNESLGINTQEGILKIKTIQFSGKKKVNIKDYINSNNFLFKIGDLVN